MTEGEREEEQRESTWRVHVLGPDDLIPMPNEIRALRDANMLNIAIWRLRLKDPNNPYAAQCVAVVERNGIEYSKDQYPRPNEAAGHHD